MKGCRVLTANEVARVSQAFCGTYAARDRALFILGIKTGFRISELLSLPVGDVWQHGRFVDYVAVQRRFFRSQNWPCMLRVREPFHVNTLRMGGPDDGFRSSPVARGVS
jgi:Phage integrase family